MKTDLSAPLVVERIGPDDMSMRALATLRMTVFRSWPYLYDGSLEYEADYLKEFLSDRDAVVIVARVGEIAVGMATASPMKTQSDSIKAPFLEAGFNTGRIFYFGESVLLPQFRGQGVGHRFFDQREAAAIAAGADYATFCAVVRGENDPRRPANARPLTDFWRKRGYRPAPCRETTLTWKEVGQADESDHPMRFWFREIGNA